MLQIDGTDGTVDEVFHAIPGTSGAVIGDNVCWFLRNKVFSTIAWQRNAIGAATETALDIGLHNALGIDCD